MPSFVLIVCTIVRVIRRCLQFNVKNIYFFMTCACDYVRERSFKFKDWLIWYFPKRIYLM